MVDFSELDQKSIVAPMIGCDDLSQPIKMLDIGVTI